MIRSFGVLAVLVGSVAACSDGVSNDSTAVPLVQAPTEMAAQCRTAAEALEFAVPCPSRVPIAKGRGLTCEAPPPTTDLPPCVGIAGTQRTFFLQFTDFDVGRGYRGVDGKPEGHVLVTASPVSGGAPRPCIGTVQRRGVMVPWGAATIYRCSSDGLRVQRQAMHGEGAQLGHVLLAWTQNGIVYSVSAHGDTAVNLRLIERFTKSMILVQP